MVIEQSNAQWRREIATADTASTNRSNEINAKSLLDISNTAYSNLWQGYRDDMDWAYKNSDSERERITLLASNAIAAAAKVKAAEVAASAAESASLGSSIMGLLTTNLTGTVLSSFT